MATLYRMPTCTDVEAWLPTFIRYLETEYGITVRVTQLNGTYGPSGGTHAGKGGAIDLIVVRRSKQNLRTLTKAYKLIEKAARLFGADASWFRPYNWDYRKGIAHCHITLTGCTHKSQAAKDQLTGPRGVRKGKNGLANGATDPGYKPLSGRTWKQGLDLMVAALKPTAPIVNPSPARRLVLVQLINHGAASVALKRPGAWAKWLGRRIRLVSLVKHVRPDVLGGLECGAGAAWKYLVTKYAQWDVVPVSGAHGRWLFRNIKTIPVVVEDGVFRPTAAYAGRIMDSPWFIGQKPDGARVLFGLAHLDHEASDTTRVRCMTQIMVNLEQVAKVNGMGHSQIVVLADKADLAGVVGAMLVKRGYGSVFKVATKTVNADLASNTYYKKPVVGKSVDDVVVWVGTLPEGKGPDNPRPVAEAMKGTDYKATDHLDLVADISYQEPAPKGLAA